MNEPHFTDTDAIDGVIVTSGVRYEDGRGWLMEFFRHDEMDASVHPAMGYLSVTKPGLSRGPHEHREQSDVFCFAGPGTFCIGLWDNREGSATFDARMRLTAGSDAPLIITVPPGVVHGYRCISKEAGLVVNVPNRLYRGEGKRDPIDEIRHEDDPANPFRLDFEAMTAECTR